MAKPLNWIVNNMHLVACFQVWLYCFTQCTKVYWKCNDTTQNATHDYKATVINSCVDPLLSVSHQHTAYCSKLSHNLLEWHDVFVLIIKRKHAFFQILIIIIEYIWPNLIETSI